MADVAMSGPAALSGRKLWNGARGIFAAVLLSLLFIQPDSARADEDAFAGLATTQFNTIASSVDQIAQQEGRGLSLFCVLWPTRNFLPPVKATLCSSVRATVGRMPVPVFPLPRMRRRCGL